MVQNSLSLIWSSSELVIVVGSSMGLARSASGSYGAKPVGGPKVVWAGRLYGARGGSYGARPVSTGLVLSFLHY